jgi:hypothetical protein
LLIALLVIDFAQLGLLVLDIPDHLVHSQVQVLAFLKQINNLLVEHPLLIPDRMVTSQIHQMHVASVIRAND